MLAVAFTVTLAFRCPFGQMLIPNSEEVCVNINECLGNPCVHGECIDRDRGFECHCFAGYSGMYCTAKEEAYRAYVSHGFIIAIIICVLVLLCKYLKHFVDKISCVYKTHFCSQFLVSM